MPVLDIDFDMDTEGMEPATFNSGPMGPPFPATKPQAFGAFVDLLTGGPLITTGTTDVSFTVGDVAGMDNAVIMSNAWAGASATNTTVGFIDHTFSVPDAARSRLEFDFSQLSTPSGTNAGYRSDWLVVGYKVNSNPGQIAWTIGTRHGFPGQIFLQQNSPNSITIGTYTNGVVTHVELVSYNEGGGRFDVWLNGELAANNVPFNNPMFNDSDQVKEIFIQQIAAQGSINAVAYDNLQFTLLIPEPSPVVMAVVALVGLWFVIRRRRC